MRKTLILGLGISGKSAAEFLVRKNEDVLFGYDDNIKNFSEENIVFFQKNNVHLLKNQKKIDEIDFDRVIVSPGIALSHPVAEKLIRKKVKISSEVQIALDEIKNHICIGITGTNGKTTTSLLICHMLNKANKRAACIGNVGRPITSYLKEIKKDDILVIELSSYQIDLLNSPFLDIALLLNISQDHLDRYESFQAYAFSKLRISKLRKKNGLFFTSQEIIKTYSDHLEKNTVFCFDEKTNLAKHVENFIKNQTKANIFSFLAAFRICEKLNVNVKDCVENYLSFVRPKHRVEFVAEIKGACYYNDSKATNVEATLFAIDQMNSAIILLAGGDDKGLNYKKWEKPFLKKIKKVFAFGKSAKKIKKDLPNIEVEIKKTMKAAILAAYKIAKKKDAVLLSPGSSSFDMFQNFEHRGKEFIRIVSGLKR